MKIYSSYCARLLSVRAIKEHYKYRLGRRGHFRLCLSAVFIFWTWSHSLTYEPLNFNVSLDDLSCLSPESPKNFKLHGFPSGVSHPQQATCTDNSQRTLSHNYGMMPMWWIQAAAEHHQQHWSTHDYRNESPQGCYSIYVTVPESTAKKMLPLLSWLCWQLS